MKEERKKFTFENLVSIYFRNLHKIIFTNVLFGLPTIAVALGLYFLTRPFGVILNLVIPMLTVIICYPLWAGVTLVTRNIGRGDDVRVLDTFLDGVRSNYKQFFIHSIYLYFILTIGVLTFSFYSKMAIALGGTMIVLFIAVILIAIWLLFAMFYVPLMTVTFDLSTKDIFKNSGLMALGEIKVNLVSLFSILILSAICTTPIMFTGGNVVALLVITLVMLGLIYPASLSFISTFFVQNNMMLMLTGRGDQVHDRKSTEEKIAKLRNETEEDFSDVDVEKLKKSKEEYFFHNGKMMKRDVLLSMIEKKENENE